jgi:hypothetical protein
MDRMYKFHFSKGEKLVFFFFYFILFIIINNLSNIIITLLSFFLLLFPLLLSLYYLLLIFVIVNYRFDIENGIVGIKRDAFLKILRYTEYVNKRKLRMV